jgi:peptide/nickel transport system ATP-binding protein
MTAPLLELSAVSHVYSGGGLLSRRRVRAVDGVSLVIDANRPEVFAIIGESGSGKTTLARMILNIVPPTEGTIRFRGEELRHACGRRERRRSCGRFSRSSRTPSRHSIH